MPIYIRILLGVVVPSESISSLVFLAIGSLGLLFCFYQLGLKRTRKLSLIASRIEFQVSSKVFSKFLALKYNYISSNFSSKLENMNQNNSELNNYIRDELAIAILDAPFLMIYFVVIYLIVEILY